MQTDMKSKITSIINKHKEVNGIIEFEVTESFMTTDNEVIKKNIKSISDLGIRIAIDDFGKGLSSLSRLNSLDADLIKLDRGFLDENTISDKSTEIIKYVILMAKALELRTVAEGIETQNQLSKLKTMQCDIGQGYLFGKPMHENSIKELFTIKKTINLSDDK